MEAVAALKSVLCGPDGKCCISGSQVDRDIVDSAIRELEQAGVDSCKYEGELPPCPLLPKLASTETLHKYTQDYARQALAGALKAMEVRKDAAYLERNHLVSLLSKLFPSGTKRTSIEGWSNDWHGCVYIDLPTGQASWHYHDSQAHLFSHLPAYEGEWDGHSTEEKYRRIAGAEMRTSATNAVEHGRKDSK